MGEYDDWWKEREPAEIANLATRVMPLRAERSPTERRIEAQKILIALAHDLSVDQFKLEWGGSKNVPKYVDKTAHQIYTVLYQAVPDQNAADAHWAKLGRILYLFDAAIEDALAAKSETLSAGYQLGRGLAESYWFESSRFAQPPGEGAAAAWVSLLGKERCNELERIVGRLSSYFGHFTAPAVAGALEVWKAVAADEQWRSVPETWPKLQKQVRRWYELVVIGQDPTTLVQPYSVFRNFAALRKAVRAFIVPLLVAALSLGLIVGLAFLASYGKTSAWFNSLLGVLSATGLTIAAAQARLKNSAQALLRRITEDAYTEMIAADLVEIPTKPGFISSRTSSSSVPRPYVRNRRLTTATSNDP